MELYQLLLLPGISHKELVDAARQHFSGLSSAYREDTVPILPRCRFTGSEVKLFLFQSKQAAVAKLLNGYKTSCSRSCSRISEADSTACW